MLQHLLIVFKLADKIKQGIFEYRCRPLSGLAALADLSLDVIQTRHV